MPLWRFPSRRPPTPRAVQVEEDRVERAQYGVDMHAMRLHVNGMRERAGLEPLPPPPRTKAQERAERAARLKQAWNTGCRRAFFIVCAVICAASYGTPIAFAACLSIVVVLEGAVTFGEKARKRLQAELDLARTMQEEIERTETEIENRRTRVEPAPLPSSVVVVDQLPTDPTRYAEGEIIFVRADNFLYARAGNTWVRPGLADGGPVPDITPRFPFNGAFPGMQVSVSGGGLVTPSVRGRSGPPVGGSSVRGPAPPKPPPPPTPQRRRNRKRDLR